MGNLLNTCAPIPPSSCSSPKTISQQYNASHCAASSQEVNLNLTISTVSHQEETSPHMRESAGEGVERDTEASPEPQPEHEAEHETRRATEHESQLQTQSQSQPETETEQEQEHQVEPESGSQQPKDVMATCPVLKPALVDVLKHRISPPSIYLTGLADHEARWKVDRSVWK